MYKLHVEDFFSAAHVIRGHQGHCRKFHGHNWKVVVEITDPILNDLGLLWDFGSLSKIVRYLDHPGALINDLIRKNASAENIADWFAERVIADLGRIPVKLVVRIYEGLPEHNNFVEVIRESE